MMQNPSAPILADYLRRALAPFLVPLQAAGLKWVLGGGIVTLIAALAGSSSTLILLFFTVGFYFVFRNPSRVVAVGASQLIAPADGMISDLSTAVLPVALAGSAAALAETQCIIIETRLPDVHVLRAPLSGIVTQLTHRPGNWGSDGFDSSASDNEEITMSIVLPDNRVAVMVITAGFLPQRIELVVKQDMAVAAGQPLGMAAFGATVMLYLPKDFTLAARAGQRLIAGETVVAIDAATTPAT